MKQIKGVNLQNEKILREMIATKIKKKLNDKENYVQNIIDKVETKIKFR